MCDAIKFLFTYLYVMYDISWNVYTYIIFTFKIMCNVLSCSLLKYKFGIRFLPKKPE
jgi:hypothetical protein